MNFHGLPLLSLSFQRFPFDWNNPTGYLAAVALEYLGFGYQYSIIACTLTYGIGIFSITISVTKEIQRILHSVNHKAQAKKVQFIKLRTLIFEYIDTHGAVKQFSASFFSLSIKFMTSSFYSVLC